MRWSTGQILQVVLLIGLSVLVTSDAWLDIYQIAEKDEESSHIFLVPVVAAWLVWVRKERLRHLYPRPTLVGPAIMLAGWVLYSVGDRYLFQAFWHFGAILVGIGAFVAVAGRQYFVRFFAVFALLAFLVPVPGFLRQAIAIPLQNWSAIVTAEILVMFGTDVTRTGNALEINGIPVAIAEACNGMRMVFALVLVSYAFAFGTPLRGFMRFIILVASPFSAILCNVIRLVPTVWIYGNYPESVAESFHDVSGWVMLPISFLILLGMIRLLRWAQVPAYRFHLAYAE